MRTAHDKHTLEDFALKSMHFASMTGVCLGAHAVSDAFLLMHSGVGCKYKTASQAAQHDWGEHPNVREAWTQVSEAHLVAGCATRIGPFARAWWERRSSALMVVVSAYFIELTGDDVRNEVTKVEETLPDCQMVYVPTAAPNQGFFDGYAAVMREVMGRMDWSRPPTQPRQAAVYGFFFHRYEPDCKGDVSQLKALMKAANVDAGAILFSGGPYADIQRAPEAKYALMLPYARPHREVIEGHLAGREIVHLDLPIGIAGTCRFVRELAVATGTDVRRVDAWLKSQVDGLKKELDRTARYLERLSFAVFAETPLAAGLVSLLSEIGVRVPVVGLRDTEGCLGGKEEFLAILARNGVSADGIQIMQEPSLRRIQEVITPLGETGELTGIIGSTHEVDLFVQLPPTHPLSGHIVLIEAGFPQNAWHPVFGQPTFGFLGVASWAQRVADAWYAPRVASGGTFT